MKDPVVVTVGYGAEELVEEGFDFGLEEGGGHEGEEGFKVVFDKVHYDVDSKKGGRK